MMPKKKTNGRIRKREAARGKGAGSLAATEPNRDVPSLNLIGCNNVQIGDGNVMTTFISDDSHASSQKDKERKKGQEENPHREELGILILKEVLAQCREPVIYDEFEKMVTTKLNSSGPMNFGELSGWHLDHFIIKHKDTFETYRRKQNKFIRMKNKSKTLMEQTSHSKEDTKRGCGRGIAFGEDKTFPLDKEYDDTDYDSEDDDDNDVGGDYGSEGLWVKVQRKGTKSKIRKETAKIEEAGVAYLRSLANFDIGKFDMLIRKGQSVDIMYVSDIVSYLSDPLLFSLDIVSLWNTPQRIKSYIIIGIDSNSNKGISDPLDNLFWQEQFQSAYFTTKPVYTCKTAFHEGRLFGVIEVGSSHGTGAPCVVKQKGNAASFLLETGSIWIRKGTNNIIIKTTDTDVSSIFHWFIGNTCSSEEKSKSVPSTKKSEMDQIYSSSSEYFWKAVHAFNKGHFVLLAGNIPNTTKHLEALALPPWVAVYDFDIFSSCDGLLNIVQDKLEKTRNLKLRTWKEPSENISERGTVWCFMRGRKEIPDSRTDLRDRSIEETSIWMKMVKSNLYNNCEKLVRFTEDYTVLTIVLIWPSTEELLPFMLKALDRIYESLSCAPNIVICINNQPTSEFSKARLQILHDEIKTSLHICCVTLEELFLVIKQNMSEHFCKSTKFSLPVSNTGCKVTPITETDAAWMRDDFEVLYLESQYTRGIHEMTLEEEIDEFYKGGNLHWFAWYECAGSEEQIVIERSRFKALEQMILPLLNEYKTTVVTLFHAPGSGGTTLAQAILWNLHKKVPCIHMKLRTGSSTDEILKKVSFLYEKTGLAVLILIDGEEESKVRYISRRLKYAIILYVKGYPYAIESQNTNTKFFLKGLVTPNEANQLTSKFAEKHEGKKTALRKLKEDICKNGVNHYLFEFGMTVHLHEFKGIVSYVSGYLQLNSRRSLIDLSPAQKCIGYLALVYYYGQTSVPCHFFASLFGKPPNYTMSLEDFPHPIQEFVVYDKNESKQNNIRICHYFVAKEILEQILVCDTKRSKQREEGLSLNACRNLKTICEDFIQYASKRKTRNLAASSKIRIVLTKTFIFRDERDMSENDEQARRKPVLSKLMSDIPSGKPLFTEKLDILKKLSSSFPDDPNFCAHLGRFYAFCRSDENEAEQCFEKAIHLCDKMSTGKDEEDIDEGIKLSLMHIYHMYGMVKQRRVSSLIKQNHKKRALLSDDISFQESLVDIVSLAEEACYLFRKSRDITPDTQQQYLYAFTGEIKTRLQVCEFILQFFHQKSKTRSIPTFLESNAHPESKIFVQHSILIIYDLVVECYSDVDLFDENITSLQKNISWYNSLFQRQIISVQAEPSTDSISHRRLKIAEKKLKYGTGSALTNIENITDKTDIEEIITMYEQNFDDVTTYGLQIDYGKADLERDFRDWILGIRNENFKKIYSLEYVLSYVEKWHNMVPSPLATFYKFVLHSLLGFGTESTPCKSECLQNALLIQESLEKLSRLIIRPKYPREWFGVSTVGIKQLVPGKRHVGVSSERSNDIILHNSDLVICKGTIMHPNTHRLSGRIDFNMGLQSVRVFFIPKVVDLEGKRYVNKRVEFVLGFSLEHGYEAYKVKLLKRYGCSKCNANIEFTSAENDLLCKCGNRVYKDELSEVKESDILL